MIEYLPKEKVDRTYGKSGGNSEITDKPGDPADKGIVLEFDAGGDEIAVGEELIDVVGGLEIVFAHVVFEKAHSDLSAESGGAVIIIEHVPDIAHGSVAVANVSRGGRFADAFAGTGFVAENQVVRREIQPGKRRRHEGKIDLTFLPGQRQTGDERFDDLMGIEGFLHFLGIPGVGENIGVGKELAEFGSDVFTSAHIGEPVMDQGNFVHVIWLRGKSALL